MYKRSATQHSTFPTIGLHNSARIGALCMFHWEKEGMRITGVSGWMGTIRGGPVGGGGFWGVFAAGWAGCADLLPCSVLECVSLSTNFSESVPWLRVVHNNIKYGKNNKKCRMLVRFMVSNFRELCVSTETLNFGWQRRISGKGNAMDGWPDGDRHSFGYRYRWQGAGWAIVPFPYNSAWMRKRENRVVGWGWWDGWKIFWVGGPNDTNSTKYGDVIPRGVSNMSLEDRFDAEFDSGMGHIGSH